jgi:hypothetical protein
MAMSKARSVVTVKMKTRLSRNRSNINEKVTTEIATGNRTTGSKSRWEQTNAAHMCNRKTETSEIRL